MLVKGIPEPPKYNQQPQLLNQKFVKTENHKFVKTCLSLLVIGPVNYHVLARIQVIKWKHCWPNICKVLTTFFGFSTYLAKNEAVLHNNMLVYNNPCKFANIESV